MNTKQQLQIANVLTNLELDRNKIARRLNVDRTTVSRTLSGERAAEGTLNSIAEVVADSFKELVRTTAEPATN